MAYDEELADRVREALSPRRHVAEIKMFGGLCFTVNGNMAIGVVKDELMVRLDHEEAHQALAEPYVRQMDFTGKPMKGFLYIAAEGCSDDASVGRWADVGADFAASLPPKRKKRKKAKKTGRQQKSARR